LLNVNSGALIVVERIVWPQRPLADYAASSGPLLPDLNKRLVLGVHCYHWSGPGRFLPNWSVPPRWKWTLKLLRAVGVVSKDNYGDMGRDRLRDQLQMEWGGVLDADSCPVWISEFGADLSNPEEMGWLQDFVALLAEKDVDWAYWPLNVGPKPGCDEDEAYGMLGPKWKPKASGDERLQLLQAVGLKPCAEPDVDIVSLSEVEPAWPSSPLATARRRCGTGSAPDLCRLMAGKDPLRGVKSVPNVQELLPALQELPHLPLPIPVPPRRLSKGMRKVFSAGDAIAPGAGLRDAGGLLSLDPSLIERSALPGHLRKCSSAGGPMSPVMEEARSFKSLDAMQAASERFIAG